MMSQKDVGNKIPIYKLKTTDEVMKYYDCLLYTSDAADEEDV